MRHILTLIANAGSYLVGLSDRTRLVLVSLGLLLLGGGAVYKLVVSIQDMTKPIPAATPAELIKPMQQLIWRTSKEANAYQQSRLHNLKQLDSISTMHYNQEKPSR